MEKTPNALRKHIAILGNTNVGKSTLFNALAEQDNSIVSSEAGTTTDPVKVAMELIPFGAVVLIDTAGINDSTSLGQERVKRTEAVLRRTDVVIYTEQIDSFDEKAYKEFAKKQMPHIVAFTKCDIAEEEKVMECKNKFKEAVFLYKCEESGIKTLRERLSQLLTEQQPETSALIGDLLEKGSTVVMVIPIDSEAPKGRLILPQVQLLRELLDHNIKCLVTRETELEDALTSLNKVDLVVTDSQVFAYVNERVNREIALTSFSILLARQKGNFEQLLKGVQKVEELEDGSNILMLEGCTHNSTHEDIGRVKIPTLLHKKTDKNLNFDYYSGYNFPEDISKYDLAIQCGNCMINKKEITARLISMKKQGLAVTNYGLLLAYLTGILDRSIQIFKT